MNGPSELLGEPRRVPGYPNSSSAKFHFRVPSSEFQVPSSKFRVPSSEFQVPSSKFQVPISEFQVPSSKFRQVPSCKFRQVSSSKFRVPSSAYFKFPVYYYYIGFYSILLNFYQVSLPGLFLTALSCTLYIFLKYIPETEVNFRN